MKKFIVTTLAIAACFSTRAQEMQGLSNSNYAGLQSLPLNPSGIADSRLYLDINFITTGASFQCDLNKNAYTNFRFNGPGVMLNKGRHAFAFTTGVRSAVSYRKTDMYVSGVSQAEIVKVAGLAWAEVGLSYAYMFKRFERNVWAAGLTLKPLGGGGGAFFAGFNNGYQFNNSISYNLQNSGINSGGGGYGAGTGFGADIGVTYQKKTRPVNLLTFKKLCQQKFQDYNYKIGLSIIDIGSIRFTKKVNTGQFNENLTGQFNGIIDSSDIEMITDTNNQNYASSLSQNKYSVSLPTAACIQFDYHWKKNWFINGTFVQGLTFSETGVRRPTLLAVTPRFEKRWFEASMPLSASDFKYFRLGLALRLWNFSIGTDNLLGSMGIGTNAGFDIYTSIRLNFAKGRCGKKKGDSMFDPFKQLAS